jgi:hypothetical protein
MITWLHLSDLHVIRNDDKRGDLSIVLDALWNDIERQLIEEHFLKPSTQALLSVRSAYRACPVVIDSFSKIEGPIADTVDRHKIFTEKGDAFNGSKIV